LWKSTLGRLAAGFYSLESSKRRDLLRGYVPGTFFRWINMKRFYLLWMATRCRCAWTSRLGCARTLRGRSGAATADRGRLRPCYTFPMKRLIVNADDFGLTRGVNRAITACYQRGIVSSATLMATGACFEEAVELAKQMPRLSVGCHIVLVDGEPLLPAGEVRSLLAPGTNRFHHSIGEVLRAVALGRFKAAEVEAEAGAQLARLRSAGVRISHFDAHKHTHMFPSILRPLLRAASAHGVRAVRNPFEAPGAVRFSEALGNPALLLRKTETTLLRAWLRRRWLKAVRQAGFATTDGSLGVASTGTMNEAGLRAMLRRIPEGIWELVCHPGYNDRDLAAVRTRLRESREVEMRALLDISEDELRETFGTELVAFGGKSARPAGAANI
jgi:chitin disaccharide deacetylase